MDTERDALPRRTSSSTDSSRRSRSSAAALVKSRRQGRTPSEDAAPTPSDKSAKSFTSFPSLSPSPDNSPVVPRPEPQGLPELPKGTRTPARSTTRTFKGTQSIVGTLLANPPTPSSRSALFDDAPQGSTVLPGNLHVASDAHLEHAVARNGPVALVRQLAADLAQRDAQMTTLRRKAEERERVLRKMLRECEVSNLDIENRLRAAERNLEEDNAAAAADGGLGAENDGSSQTGSRSGDAVSRRISQAVNDGLAAEEPSQDWGLGLEFDGPDYQAGPAGQTPDLLSPGAENRSIDSELDHPKGKGISKGWKDYFWVSKSAANSKAPSIVSTHEEERTVRSRGKTESTAQGKGKVMDKDFFKPPALQRTFSGSGLRRINSEPQESASSSRRSSAGVTSWALKLVAGNNQSSRDDAKNKAVRGRSSLAGAESSENGRMSSTASGTRINANAVRGTGRGKPTRMSLGPNGTIKSLDGFRNAPVKNGPTSPMEAQSNAANLGPVEMDTILPDDDSQPPALRPQKNVMAGSEGLLTDRFGYIYDQRRKRRQNEAAAALRKQNRSSQIESISDARAVLLAAENGEPSPELEPQAERPPTRDGSITSVEAQNDGQSNTRWYDFLRMPTFPTELLSHTPSAPPIDGETDSFDIVESPPKASPMSSANKRTSVPGLTPISAASESEATHVLAEFATPSRSGRSTPVHPSEPPSDPVKVLLQQLTEVHDALQRERTVKWNDFQRKVRAERARSSEAAAAVDPKSNHSLMPEISLSNGEIIGVAGMGVRGKVGRAKAKEFHSLCLAGIPVSIRWQVWMEASGALSLRIPGYYDDLVNSDLDLIDPNTVTQIQADITRTLTDNIYFRRGPGVQKLNEVLLAYARRNPDVGYCQGMNLIVACLLLVTPTAEDAFWLLAALVEGILPANYYGDTLLTSRADQNVLRQYVAELLPKLSSHLDDMCVDLDIWTLNWFLSLFTDCLSAEALYRVWDVLLCSVDGDVFLFQVALALLKLNESSLLACESQADLQTYITRCMTDHAISIDGLIQASEALRKVVKKADIEARRAKAVEQVKAAMEEREGIRKARNEAREKRKSRVADEVSPIVESAAEHEGSSEVESLQSAPAVMATRREEEDELAELEVRMPMPIDEEAMWRA